MAHSPPFRFQVRRDGTLFSVRFEAPGAAGVLRVARPGVLVDPPPRQAGGTEGLTAAQLRATRFLHVWDGGQKRQGHVLSRLTDRVLSGLPRGEWVSLRAASEGGFRCLVPGGPDPAQSADDDLPELDEGAVESLEEGVEPAAPEPIPLLGLVRHLRRQRRADQEEIARLRAELGALGRRLDAALRRERLAGGGGPESVDPDLEPTEMGVDPERRSR